MDDYTVKRLALVLAVQAEIEGMKTSNLIRELSNDSLIYNEGDFQERSQRLTILAHAHNEQL